MNGSLDELRRAARCFAKAEDRYNGLVAFGARASATQAKAELDAATRALVTAGDVHAARGNDGIVDLIRGGHTHESAKSVLAMRAQAKAPQPASKTRKRSLKPAADFEDAARALGLEPATAAKLARRGLAKVKRKLTRKVKR